MSPVRFTNSNTMSGRSRSRNVSSTNDRSRSGRSKSRSRRAAASKSDKGRNRNGNRRRNASSPVGPSFQTYFDEPSFQNYFDEAVKSATTKAIEIFEKRDDDNQFDDDTDFSDEFSFATPESTYSDRGGGKSSANNHSKKLISLLHSRRGLLAWLKGDSSEKGGVKIAPNLTSKLEK